jgi:hypothetical protein
MGPLGTGGLFDQLGTGGLFDQRSYKAQEGLMFGPLAAVREEISHLNARRLPCSMKTRPD